MAEERGVACGFCGEGCGTREELGQHVVSRHGGRRSVDPVPPANGHRVSAASDPLGAYRKEVVKFRLLTKEEERELGRRVRAGGPTAKEARRRMIESNLRLVLAIARTFENRGLSTIDLVQEGNIGLVKAVEKFNPALGNRFSTYATWWIKQSIRYALATSARVVRVPNHVLDLYAKARKLEREGSENVAGDLEVSEGKVASALERVAARSVSLDAAFASDSEHSLSQTLEARQESKSPLERAELVRMLRPLQPKERHVLTRRFGLDGLPPAQLEVVAHELGISRERVRQIQLEAIRRLRKRSTGVNPDGEAEIMLGPVCKRGYRRFRGPGEARREPGPAPRKKTEDLSFVRWALRGGGRRGLLPAGAGSGAL